MYYTSLSFLSKCLCQAYGKKCILIDQHDVIVSILRNDFGKYFGFMQPEVDKMLETYA